MFGINKTKEKHLCYYGFYGVMANAADCESVYEGSIPSRNPISQF